jgi:thioredoxin-dependent peroxiredoxin
MEKIMNYVLIIFSMCFGILAYGETKEAKELKIGSDAPMFELQTQENKKFDLNSRKGQWTVLYFYPKAGTPGCTKQACAFRDSIELIRKQGAEVFGISVDTVEDQAKFFKEHKLNFSLLADADAKVTNLYGSKMPVMKMSKRWTFILDPKLVIRDIQKDVDPVIDAARVAKKIEQIKNK